MSDISVPLHVPDDLDLDEEEEDLYSILDRGEKIKFEVVPRDDPNRCQANDKKEQCMFRAVQDGKCPRHMGRYATVQKERIRKYEIEQYNNRIKHFADDGDIKNLREEVAILRMTLENLLNQARTAELLNIYADRIKGLVGAIKDVVLACHKMDTSTNALIGKDIIFNMTQTFIEIVGSKVPPQLLGPIVMELEQAFQTSTDPTTNAHLTNGVH